MEGFVAFLSAFVPLPSSFRLLLCPVAHMLCWTLPRSVSSRLCPPAKASRKSSKISTCFDTEISELPAVAPPPLEKRKPFCIALKCQRCVLSRGGSTSSIGHRGAFGSLELAKIPYQRYHTVLPCIPAPPLSTLPHDVAVGQRLCRVRASSGGTRRNRVYGLGCCGCRWVF